MRKHHRASAPLALLAVLPPALVLLGPLVEVAGRLSYWVPVAAFPLGMGVKWLWKGLEGGQSGLFDGLAAAFGAGLGRFFALLYLLWGHILLSVAARRYALRLSRALGEGRWLYLAVGLLLALWLGRREKPLLARGAKVLLLCALTALGLALLVALSGVEKRNLWPVERVEIAGFLPAVALVVSLSGWGVFALAPPAEGGAEKGGTAWAAVGCGVLALLLLAVVGAFGPALTARMEDPFLYLLEGVRVPGAFRRGEAALCALLALGELALLALLVRSCTALWEGLVSQWQGRGIPVTAGGMFLLAGWWPEEIVTGNFLFWGGLFFGVALPGLTCLMRRGKSGEEGASTSCGGQSP